MSAGESWGGPARGAGNGGPRQPFRYGNRTSVGHSLVDPEVARKRRERVEDLLFMLYTLALTAERDETRLKAAVHVLDRLDGRPAVSKARS
jgi:hypothetical protein